MTRRAETVEATRQRITEAAVRLHTTVGPGRASIAAVAAEAGVTRLTVYRHFRDQEELFTACMAHWAAAHPRPDAAAWTAIPDLGPRIRVALSELYGWYADVGDEFLPIQRDFAHMPADAQARSRAQMEALVDAIVLGPAVGDETAVHRRRRRDETPRARSERDPGRRLRAVVAHVTAFTTWHSLVVEQGLSSADAVDLAAGWVALAAGSASGG